MSEENGKRGGRLERRANAGLALAVIAYVSAFYAPCLFNGLTTLLPSYQDESQWLLYHRFINDSYGRGFFPLWTPDLFCGMPFLAWSHSAALYPLDLVYAAASFGRAVWVSQWIMATVYALGLFYLIRRLGASGWAAMLAVVIQGAVFILEGLGNFAPTLRTGCVAPWLFLCVIGLVTERRFIYLVGFVSANLVMYLGGHVELTGLAYELIALGLIAAGIYYRREWRKVAAAYVLFTAAFIIGYLLSQVQALPTLELTHFSIRGEGLTYGYFKIWSSLNAGAATWTQYLASGLVLALFTAAVAGARRSAVLFLCALLFCYCLCLIHDLFGALWVLYRVPLLRDLLAHSRIIFHAGIIIAAMIALGADRVMAAKGRGWLRACGALCIMGAAVWFGFLARRPELLAVYAEPAMEPALKNLGHAMSAGMIAAAAIGALLIFSRRIFTRRPAWPQWAFMAIALCTYALPVMYTMPRNDLDPFHFPPEYARFMEEHPGLHRVQTMYPWDHWENISVPLQTGVLYGTRSADGFITVSVDRYTRFLNAIIPGTFREVDHKIADLEATKVFKEGAFVTDKNIRFLDLMGIKYLAAEERNLKFADHFFLAFPDSPLLASGNGAEVERLDVGGSHAHDLLHFFGQVSGSIFIQPGDRLLFQVEDHGPGQWLAVITGVGEKVKALEFAGFRRGPRLSEPGIDLGKRGDRTTTLYFAAIPAKGGDAEAVLRDPRIVNRSKYFKTALAGPGFTIFENPGAMAAAFLVSKVETARRDEVLGKLLAPAFDPGKQAVVEGPPLPEIRGDGLGEGEGVRVDRYAPERVELTAAAAAPRLLLLTDVYFPGWRAWVDGREERILAADYAFRGLPLGPGVHRVSMAYQPQSFRVGLWVSVGSLLCLLGAGVSRRINPLFREPR
ncbi:MAG TPA: YfhO family protein [bacterium]|nr:YfhO family protein [bacterium]